jgi:hypothetical protein
MRNERRGPAQVSVPGTLNCVENAWSSQTS